ncbi:MAG: hypothetical protein R3A52_28200 [Polyangiales bacterium]
MNEVRSGLGPVFMGVARRVLGDELFFVAVGRTVFVVLLERLSVVLARVSEAPAELFEERGVVRETRVKEVRDLVAKVRHHRAEPLRQLLAPLDDLDGV